MDLGLNGKVALVGGASQGLGKAIALTLASEGVSVIICSRNKDKLQKAKSDIERVTTSKRVVAVEADLAEPEQQRRVVTTGLAEFGFIDILICNTGGPPPGSFEKHSQEAWDQAYRLLLASAVGLIREVLPKMKTRKWGRIITVTSQAVKQPVDGLILSNSIRASLVGLIRTLANEVGEYGITVNNVMPGFTKTERLIELIEFNKSILRLEEIPLGRVGEPEEPANLVAFLASIKAGYITGASIPVDGGWIKSLL